jgi:hypothetical protein
MNEPSVPRVQFCVSRLAVLVVAGCAGAPLKPAVSLETPVAACRSTNDMSLVEIRARPEDARRDELRRELAAVEAAVDALDDEISAAAVAVGPSRDDALNEASTRMAILSAISLDNFHPDAPRQLRRLQRLYFDARAGKFLVDRDYGPRHPDVVEATHRIDRARAAFERQKSVELDEARGSYDEIAKLPKNAPPARVRQARLRAMLRVVDQFAPEALAPSNAPAEVRIAVDRVTDIARELDGLTAELGPKHPDMVRLVAAREEAAAALQTAIAATDDALAREIAALAAPKPPPAIDGSKLAKRVELAARARDLRRELDALSP